MYQLTFLPHLSIRETAAAPVVETETASAVFAAYSILPQLIDQVADEFESRLSAAQRANLGRRLSRARTIAKKNHVIFTETEQVFKVVSQDNRNANTIYYTVDIRSENYRDWSCTCPDHVDHDQICKHILASYFTKSAFELASEQASQPQETESTESQEVILPGEHVIYATVIQDDVPIRVEILGREGDLYHIRALPVHDENGQLVPLFPFPSPFGGNVMCSTADVSKPDLHEVRVFSHSGGTK